MVFVRELATLSVVVTALHIVVSVKPNVPGFRSILSANAKTIDQANTRFMIHKILAVVFFTCIVGSSSAGILQKDSLPDYFYQSDLVVIGTIVGSAEGSYGFKVDEVFKGKMPELFSLRLDTTLSDDGTYLIYGVVRRIIQGRKDYSSAIPIRIASLKDAMDEINVLVKHAPCVDTSLKDRPAGCLRSQSPVCGCNGVTYDSGCEARLLGIVRYRVGRCED